MYRNSDITRLLFPVFASTILLALVFSVQQPAYADVSITRAELDRGKLRVEGEGAPNATISINGLAQSTADDQGRFKVQVKNFSTSNCQITVSDGSTSQIVTLDPCTPAEDDDPEAETPPAFAALEIGPLEEPLEVPAALHQSPVRNNSAQVPAGLPRGAIAELVIEGVVTGVDNPKKEWRIGNPPLFVYPSASTRFDDAPQVGDLVRVIAVRSQGPGPLIAERIRQRAPGPLPAGPAEVELGFLFSGLVTRDDRRVWTIGGVNFAIIDNPEPTEIEDVGRGSLAVVGFVDAAAIVPVEPD